ncbi:MAG: DedA family protein [bacterium]
MEVFNFINYLVDFVLHIDKHLAFIIQKFGVGSYFLLFIIIFAETGLVVTPILPGDSLLFAAGAFAAQGSFNIFWLWTALFVSGILGNSTNYAIGNLFGTKMFRDKSRFLKKEYLDRTHRFYEKYGAKTIVIARFIPIVRTFAPFIAGVGKMTYLKFSIYNITGNFLWISAFLLGGYYFGNIPIIKRNFTVTIFIIIFLSIMPAIIEVLKHHLGKNKLYRVQ